VYVNGQIANRKGEYFWKELSMNNTTGSVWQPVAVTATGLTTVTGNVFVAKTPEVFSYDLDGNMTSDGRWNYTWDAENRLIKVESLPDTPSSSWRRIEWTYDALGRRIQQVTSIWTNNAWFVVENLKFVSDPMLFGRHIVELNATNNTLVRSYVWGLDLSGTMDSAGGVGGLAWVTLHTATGPASGTHFTCYDGNGNIVSLVSATTDTETACYEFGPLGEPIRVTGSAAALNPFRFSTKRTCNTTELVLYEYRAYNPALGCWLSRDPVEGNGGVNVYGFINNDPVGNVDLWGLKKSPACVNQCYQNLEVCYSPENIASYMEIGAVSLVTGAASAVMGAGPHTTPTGKPKKLYRAGKSTQYSKNLVKGFGANALAGAGVGILALHARCLAEFAGCLSGCPDIPEPRKCLPAPVVPPGLFNCNVNAPPACFVLPVEVLPK
jgi:RHS repeat-associated protein